jgi:hypothetical protein
MTDYRTAFPSSTEFLRHADFQGEAQLRRIRSATPTTLTSSYGDEDVIIVTLDPANEDPTAPLQLKCTRRLCKEIARATGTANYAEWPDCEVELFPTTVQGYGKSHDVIGARKAAA